MNYRKIKHTRLKLSVVSIVDILVVFLSMSFPDYVLSGAAANFFSYAQLLLSLSIVASLLFGKIGKFTKIHFLVFCTFLIPVLSTLINGQPKIITSIKTLLMNFSLFTYIGYRLSSKTNISFYKNALKVLAPLVLFNTITLILCYRNKFSGINDFYFLGNDNGSIFETFLLIEYSVIYNLSKHKQLKKMPFLLTIITLIGYIRTMSGNAMVACMLMLMLLFLYNSSIAKRILKPACVGAIYIAFFLLVVIGRGDSGITGSILSALGKDNTYTGRTIIWDKMLEHTKNKPLVGNGYETPETQVKKYGHIKAHNIFIQTLYDGGLLELLSILLILSLALFSAKKLTPENAALITGLVLIYLIICTFDYYNYKYHLIMAMVPILARTIN